MFQRLTEIALVIRYVSWEASKSHRLAQAIEKLSPNEMLLKNKLEWQSKQKYKFRPCLRTTRERETGEKNEKKENLESNNFYVFLKVFVVAFAFITSQGQKKSFPIRISVPARKLSNVSF